MNPVLSIGAYLLMQGIVLSLSGQCLHAGMFPRFLRKARGIRIVVLTVYLLLALLPVAGALLPESDLKYTIQGAGDIWLGFFVYSGGILSCLYLALFILQKLTGRKTELLRMPVLVFSIAAGTVILIYGMVHAQNTIVTKYDLTIEKNAGDLSGLKVVLIADLHLSVNSRLSTIERMVETINAEKPDVILIAGDIFTSSYRALKDPEKYADVLRRLETKDGVFAVYGNHDVEETLFGGFPVTPVSRAFRTREMEQFFEKCGFTVLYDEMVSIAGGLVQVVGRIDGDKAGDGTALRKSPSEVLADVDNEKPVIVLQHEPREFSGLKESGADLVLCGHTHAGQIFPGNLIVPFFNENAYGYRKVSGLDTVVTSGIGYYGPPMRVGTNSEIMILDLHFLS